MPLEKCLKPSLQSQYLQADHDKSFSISTSADSKPFFDAETKSQRSTEKRLIIYFLNTRKAIIRFAIDSIDLVSGKQNPAGALNRLHRNGTLTLLLTSFTDKTGFLQWIGRSRL